MEIQNYAMETTVEELVSLVRENDLIKIIIIQ